MSRDFDLGAVSAYALAVEGGYTGTEAEFKALLADIENIQSSAAGSATSAAASAATASQKVAEITSSIDSTLSREGSAADAKEVGTRFATVNEQIGKRFETSVLVELPQSGTSDTLYIVPAPQSTAETPLFAIYLWDDKWIPVGGTGTGSLDEEALADVLADYYTKTDVDLLLQNIDLSNYYTKQQVDDQLATVPSSTDVEQNTSNIEEIAEQLLAVGVSIQSIEDEDGVTRQYLVNSNGEPLGDAIVSTGGSGGGGGSTSGTTISVTMSSQNPSSVELGKGCQVSFWWTSLYTDGGSTGNGTISFSVKSGTSTVLCATKTLSQAPIGATPISFDFGTWLKAGTNVIIVQIKDSEGNTTSRRLTITAQVLGLEVDYNWASVNTDGASIRWRVSGSSGVTFHATLANAPISTVSNPTVGRWQTLSIPHKEHGTYRLRLWTSLTMDDGSTITSSITGFDILFVDSTASKVLIASDFSTEEPLQQYTANTIRYFVYDPQAEASDVTRLVDNTVYAEDSAVERLIQEWKWKPIESGQHTVGIRAGQGDNQTTRNFVVTVSGVDIPDSVKEVSDYALKFNPSGHQNSDTNPLDGICKDSNGNSIACSVNEGFDWTNGGIQYDSLGNAYFCIMSGDRLTIDYAPFATDCKPTGRHIKICFNTTEVANRSTPFLSCVDAAVNGNAVGLLMTPTSATITSEQSQSLSTRYIYDRGEYFGLPNIEMDINIQKSSQERLIQFWMGGCPAQVIQYTTDDGFSQNQASNLVFGSDECEVHLYLLKIADNSWEDEEITDDWMMNAPSGEEMVNRYNRNKIYAMDGTIDFDALPEKLVKVIISAAQWTTGKEDENYIIGTVDFYIDGKHGVAECKFKGQGTSSMGYIGGGLNIDINLTSNVTWDDGTTTTGIQISENAIPVTYLNYKVNIASSESYKNMLYAHDYQTFQPYIRPARQANPNVRDSMEFRMSLLCFRNTSEETVWAGNTPYAAGVTALYAVGNLGNSKKNFAALGQGVTEANAATECLVECTENTTVYQLMHEPVPDDDDITFPDANTAFEFRFPKKPTELMKENFRSMERWVASTCTEPEYITGDELDEMYIVQNGKVTYRTNSNGTAVTVYDSQSRQRKVVDNCPYDTETIEVDGEYYTVLPLDSEGKEITGYSHDTEAYRLGKFLQEFDNHFVFNSIAYHYHVTHQFTMIDNRAKNTFYGTEDGQHWHLVFAYDGDTQMGNNNSGDLTLDYGLEDTDKIGGGYVFNGARHTLWVNMRKLFDKNSAYYNAVWYGRMQAVYQAAETAGAWSPSRRLKLMQEWCGLVPEVLWRDDAHKKYMNPLLNGDDASYLSKCNGTCLDQAAQFVVENQPYFASMWQTSANRENLVTMRGYTPEEYPAGYTPSSEIKLTAFSKCYLTVDYDGDLQKPVRLNPGETATFTQGDVKLNDTPVYIPGAQLISAMSPVSRLYPGFCNFNYLSNCQNIVVGESGSYSNANLTALTVGGCKKLRNLDVRNTPNLTGTLDVSNSRELRTMLAQGSGISGVAFADGGKLETYHGGGNIASMVARGLKSVQVFDLQDYSKVSRINIEDSPAIDTGDILSKAQNVARIRLTGINWNLTGTELLHRLYLLRGLDASGNDTERAVLMGSVHIVRAKESEIAIFEQAWPLLEITCTERVKEYTVTYVDEDGETELYSELYEENAVWSNPITSGNMSTPEKASEERIDYSFSGWDITPSAITSNITLQAQYTAIPVYVVTWMQDDNITVLYTKRFPQGAAYTDPVANGEIGTPTKDADVESVYTFKAWDYNPGTVTMDMSIYATYSRTARKYTVTWYDYGDRQLQQLTCVAHGNLAYSGSLNLTRPSSQAGVKYLWLGEWDGDTTDVVSNMSLHPVFIECRLPAVSAVPSGWYIYSDNPDDNMVYTRSEFAAIVLSDEETVRKYLAVGDKIKLILSTSVVVDTELIYTLHAFKHYKLADDSGYFASTTWYPVGVLANTRQMNGANTNVGGWAATPLRSWLNDKLYPEFPLFWKCLIKQVDILSSKGNSSSEIVTSKDYLYLMSQAEIGFSASTTPYKEEVDADAENRTFALYTSDASRIKKTYNGTGSAVPWWLRSPLAGSSSTFNGVYASGSSYYNTAATYYVSLAPGFSI